jgi:hypothetical protein
VEPADQSKYDQLNAAVLAKDLHTFKTITKISLSIYFGLFWSAVRNDATDIAIFILENNPSITPYHLRKRCYEETGLLGNAAFLYSYPNFANINSTFTSIQYFYFISGAQNNVRAVHILHLYGVRDFRRKLLVQSVIKNRLDLLKELLFWNRYRLAFFEDLLSLRNTDFSIVHELVKYCPYIDDRVVDKILLKSNNPLSMLILVQISSNGRYKLMRAKIT